MGSLNPAVPLQLPPSQVWPAPTCSEGEAPPAALHTLRFFDSCNVYRDYSDNEGWKKDRDAATNPSSPHLQRLFEAYFLTFFDPAIELHKDPVKVHRHIAERAYAMCQIQVRARARADVPRRCRLTSSLCWQWGAYREEGALCAAFRDHMDVLAFLELHTDVTAFYKKGAGHPTAYFGACRLLEDFFEDTDNVLQNRDAFAHFRFAHAETIMPFLALLVRLLVLWVGVPVSVSVSVSGVVCVKPLTPPVDRERTPRHPCPATVSTAAAA